MLEIVIGGLMEPPSAKVRYTFCAEGNAETGLGFDLTPEGMAAAAVVFMRMQNPAPYFAKTQDLASCSAPLRRLFKYVDYSELRLEEGTWRFKAPAVDPVQLVLGLALAFKLDRELEGGWAVEIYSDAWPSTFYKVRRRGLKQALVCHLHTADPQHAKDLTIITISRKIEKTTSRKVERKEKIRFSGQPMAGLRLAAYLLAAALMAALAGAVVGPPARGSEWWRCL
ncbi:MAG: hypothetical protein AT715_02710 [Thermoproteus sp. JCHS_4]|nr:MAG: hypothetical protein AT715_02710 [Thermoproteus sp. JCHS_4]